MDTGTHNRMQGVWQRIKAKLLGARDADTPIARVEQNADASRSRGTDARSGGQERRPPLP